jgi:translocation and assembly module TamA
VHGRARPPGRRWGQLAAALVASLLAACAEVRGTADAPAVMRLELEGTRKLDAADIVPLIATQESERPAPIPILGPLLYQLELALELPEDAPPAQVPIVGPVVRSLRVAVGGVDVRTLDPDALAVDRRRIEAFYRERGYYGARVEDVKVTPDGPGRVEVVLRVVEGRPVRVLKIDVVGLDAAPEAAAEAGKLPLAAGDVFTEAAYDAARAQLEAALHRTGWAAGAVTQTARVLPDEATAEVRYEVKAGPRLRFGPLFVAGSAAVRRELIREQAAIEIKTGAWFDERKLARAQARVFDLGVFAGVRVTRGELDPARSTVPIVVAVREAPFRTLRFGPGLGLEATRWDASLEAEWTHRNFLGDLRRVSTDLRAGYAWLPTPFASDKAGPVGLLSLDFAQPAVFFGRVDASARLELERGLELSYDFWSERLRLGLPIRLGPRWSFVPSYNLEVYQLANVAEEPDPLDPTSDRTLQNCAGSVCLLSFLEQRVAWDGRNDPVNTRRGLYVSLSVQEGFDLFRFGYRYLRFFPEARAFVPLGQSVVLAGRARFGGLVPLGEKGEPPPVARFYGGGPASMRGYYSRQFSRLILQGRDWVPVGANGLADGSLEVRIDLGGSWGAAVFLDGAAVSDVKEGANEYLRALDPANAQFAAGVGARYRTPFGPLRLDVAVRLPSDLSAGVPFDERFPHAPYMTGRRFEDHVELEHREPIAAVHLSLGEAF